MKLGILCVFVGVLAIALVLGAVSWSRQGSVDRGIPEVRLSQPTGDEAPGPVSIPDASVPPRPDSSSLSGQEAKQIHTEAALPGAVDDGQKPVVEPSADKASATLIEAYRSERNPILRREKLRRWTEKKQAGVDAVALLAVKESDPTLVMQGVETLRRSGRRSSVPLLLKLLESNRDRPDGYGPPVCEAIVVALGACRDASAVPILLKDLAAHQDFTYDQVIVKALGEIGDPSALSAVVNQIAYLEARKPQQAIAMGPWKDAMNVAREARDQIAKAQL